MGIMDTNQHSPPFIFATCPCGCDDVVDTSISDHQEENLISVSGDKITLTTSLNYLFFRNEFPSPKEIPMACPPGLMRYWKLIKIGGQF
jgi:hypothetical protein